MSPKSPAQTLLEKADKKANSSSGWFSSSSTKFEEAGDLYQQAANSFKLEKLFREAGDAFAKEAECREKCNETNDAANAWWNAAKAYKRGFPDLAIQALSQTVVHLTQAGRFRQAADREKEIAQIYLQEQHDLRRACESFERAGDWYAQEDATATANACFKDAADLHAELEEYQIAVARYDQVASHSLGSALTKYSVKDYWLKALLCVLASSDYVSARRNLERYRLLDTTFPSTREAKFVTALLEALEQGDEEAFTSVVFEYDQVTKLDNWKTAILVKIKRGIQQAPGLT
ncbi:vesicular-fusion protein SEC17 [Russula ochroleuca]|jgi:alpha-soluble NSF attachment protein|uniref:Vesicular-fusion protein SEC17 n=1 Tax=Russula ochroleuca TaxID=152965 RepID=A0A9P5MZ26_9AGAM|nr:vesicular-fusion protein SEC17 [Russula ochroleuca]